MGQVLGIQKSIKSNHCSEKAWFIWGWEAVYMYLIAR